MPTMWAEPMSSLARICALVALAVTLGTAAPAAAAEPAPKSSRQAVTQPLRCGELPRASRAYKDCLAAQSRRDTAGAGQPAIKPVFSSR